MHSLSADCVAPTTTIIPLSNLVKSWWSFPRILQLPIPKTPPLEGNMAAENDKISPSNSHHQLPQIPQSDDNLVQHHEVEADAAVVVVDLPRDTQGKGEKGREETEEKEGDGEEREAKRRKTRRHSVALENLEKSYSSEQTELQSNGSVGGFSFSFDTTAMESPVGMTPKFGSFASTVNSEASELAADVAVCFAQRGGSEISGAEGEEEDGKEKE